jgi:alkaline phosphatase
MGINNKGVEHTGEPVMAADGKPYTVGMYTNGASSVMLEQPSGEFFGARPVVTNEEAQDIDYVQQSLVPKSSESHSGVDVALYAKGPFAHLLEGTKELNYVFHLMHHAVTAE